MDAYYKHVEYVKGIIQLAERIKIYKPKGIVILMKSIESEIRKSIEFSNVKTVKYIKAVPFPIRSKKNKNKCIEGVEESINIVLQ